MQLVKNILFVIFFINCIIYSQNLPFISYTTEDGLVQSSIRYIYQDSKGFMWFGTENGPSQFDGNIFRNLSEENIDIASWILSIVEDKKGNMWFGSRRAGLFKYDGKNIKVFNKLNSKILSNTITSMITLSDGKFLLGTFDTGLLLFSENECYQFDSVYNVRIKSISSMLRDSKGNIWIASRTDGIYKFDNKTFVNYSKSNGLQSNSIISILEDSKGNFWFGTLDTGLIKYDGKEFKLFDKKSGLPGLQINSIVEDFEGNIWVGTRYGLSLFSDGIFKNFTKSNGLKNDFILKTFRDREDNLWFGTYGGGVIKLTSMKFENFNEQVGLTNNVVLSICEDDKNNIWMGTFGGGINVFDGKNFKNYSIKNGLPNDVIWSIKKDSKDNLWLGVSDNGLYRFINNKFVDFNKIEGLNKKIVFDIYEDDQKNIWLGTVDGAYKYDGTKFEFYSLSEKAKINAKIITNIKQDKNKNFWFATQGDGVLKWDGNKFTNFNALNGLVHNDVNSILPDRLGNIWFATKGGLNKLKNGKFFSFTIKDGLPSNECYFLIEKNKFIYIGTTKGIVKFNPEKDFVGKENSLIYFTGNNGLAGSEMNIGACFVDSKGNIWFGSTNGVTKYNPSLDRINTIPPQVLLTKFVIDDKNYLIEDISDLSYDQNKIQIEYIGISHTSPKEVEYQYLMEGLDNIWTKTDAFSVKYSYLPPGKYKFRVKAKNSDGIWSKNEAILNFKINPPFWEEWWFRIALIIFVISGFISFYFIRTTAIRKRNIQLEIMVERRTKQLKDEQIKTENLLLNILPKEVAYELKEKGITQPKLFKSMSILFTDFVGFTQISTNLSPDALVKELNELFKYFDEIIQKHKLEKLKTIGDSYMVGGGIPKESTTHANDCIDAAFEMIAFLENRNLSNQIKWKMRLGIHSGQVIAGVVGKLKFTYDVWGDTVNVASRMESASEPMKINISGDTYQLVKDHYICEYRGKIEAKGKGKLDMYFVKGRK